MRNITEIILHCSATREGKDYDVTDIIRWHKAQGWHTAGYHYIIKLDGTVQVGRPIEVAGAHTLGHNDHSIGVCYIGGLDAYGQAKDTRTNRQKFALGVLLGQLHYKFPHARICGHNEFSKKACPCFDVSEYRKFFDQQ